MKKIKLQEVFKILPKYQKVSKVRKIRALHLLIWWVSQELEKLNK